ncbi:MAG TPA: TIGR03067 domain-containing protein [Candidatus Solibacter sp.]|nr:TIGR03067 domain-containing protein [Candidatus Solibacter sp.]
MKTDLELLQGQWKIFSLELDGSSIPEAHLAGASISIQGDKFISFGMGSEYRGTIELDSASVPKVLNMKFTAGPEKGNVNLGIYELDGDSWRLCLATRGSTRPHQFAAPPGTGIALEVLKRC